MIVVDTKVLVPIVYIDNYFVNDNTAIVPLTNEDVVEYYFENTGGEIVTVNNKQLLPGQAVSFTSGTVVIDSTDYKVVFDNTGNTRQLLVMKKKLVSLKALK